MEEKAASEMVPDIFSVSGTISEDAAGKICQAPFLENMSGTISSKPHDQENPEHHERQRHLHRGAEGEAQCGTQAGEARLAQQRRQAAFLAGILILNTV